MKRVLALALSMALVGSVYAADAPQDTTGSPAKTTRKRVSKKSEPTVASQLSALKEAMDAQQQQIQQLSQQISNRDQHIQQLEQKLDQSQAAAAQAQAKADAAASQAADQGQTVVALKTDVSDLKLNATNAAVTLQDTQKSLRDQFENPSAIHYKGITITPGGFLAGESVYRNHSTGGDATAFNSLLMPGSGLNRISEFYGSGRQSQITLRADGKIGTAKLTGYYEADFLSAGTTSNNNQTNSYTLRQRQAWALVALNNGWSFTGGQMWTLLTENRKGIDNLNTARPMTIDPNYTVGFTFARQYGFRVIKNFNDKLAFGVSLENPQTTFTATNAQANFALGSDGVGGGLYNPGITACTTTLNSAGAPVTVCTNAANYSFNAMPDVIAKLAADPGFGHYEIFGIFSRFRDRVYPCAGTDYTLNPSGCNPTGSPTPGPSVLGAYNNSRDAGGVGGNMRFSVNHKHVDFGLHALYGTGLGRYAASGLPDATVNPNGTLAPLKSYQGLATLEFHYPKVDIYFNGGEDYSGRHFGVDPAGGKVVGYGAPGYADGGCYAETVPSATSPGGYNFGGVGSCSGQTQSVVEGTFGFWIKPYNGPKGRIQFGPQYSYVSRNAWAGAGAVTGTSASPHAIDNLFYTSFRYYLP